MVLVPLSTRGKILVVGIVGIAIVIGTFLFFYEDASPGTDAAFIFHDAEGADAGGVFSKELGINTIPIYLDEWSEYEPVNNEWNWGNAFPDSIDDYDHCIVRIGILHMLPWNPSGIPSWVNRSDIDGEFKDEYGQFLQEAINQILQRDISVDYYLVELEANFAGHEINEKPNSTNTWIIDWIKWETERIKEIDPQAKIVIPLTPTEFRPEQSLNNTNDHGAILLADFVQRMIEAGVYFDAFGFNIASGVYDKVDDWTDVQATLDTWSTIDKDIFVWAVGYPADNDDNLPFNNPRGGGYSQAWQTEQYVHTLQLLLNNTQVIGVSIDLFDYQEAGWPSPIHWGLVGGDPLQPETLYKRPSFDAVKACWEQYAR